MAERTHQVQKALITKAWRKRKYMENINPPKIKIWIGQKGRVPVAK